MVSDRDISFYCEQGYLVVGNVLSEKEVLALRAVVDDWLECSRNVSANDDFHGLEDSHTAAAPRVRRFKDPDSQHFAFRAPNDNPKVVQVLEGLWDGAGVRFDKSKLNMKLKAAERRSNGTRTGLFILTPTTI